jgi:hypothetical protein
VERARCATGTKSARRIGCGRRVMWMVRRDELGESAANACSGRSQTGVEAGGEHRKACEC